MTAGVDEADQMYRGSAAGMRAPAVPPELIAISILEPIMYMSPAGSLTMLDDTCSGRRGAAAESALRRPGEIEDEKQLSTEVREPLE